MDAIWSYLPFLALLACPLMMVFCIFGMRRMGGDMPTRDEAQSSSLLPEERVAALQQQIQAIQAELTTLAPAEAPTPRMGAVQRDEGLVDAVPGVSHAARRSA